MRGHFTDGDAGNTGKIPRDRHTTEAHAAAPGEQESVERAHAHEPALILVEGELPGEVFRLRTGRQVIGRRPECDLRVRERAVSGIHAEILRTDSFVTIADLDSTNGTFVNGVRISAPVALSSGHLIKLGNSVLRYVDSLLEVEFTESLHARSITDPLTGLYNRSYLVSRLRPLLDSASAERPVSVIAFDFDDFKQVNDQFGHAAGDHTLTATSALIGERLLRAADIFSRVGGEEFVIALPETSLAEAMRIAEDIRAALEDQEFDYEGQPIRVTSSFGVCTATGPLETAEAFLARADELLYRSKRGGRNRVSA